MKTIENTKDATGFNDRRRAILTLTLVALLLSGTVVVFAGLNLSDAEPASGFDVKVSGTTLTFSCTSTGDMPEYADWTETQKSAIDGARSTVTTIVFPSGENKLTSIASGVFRNFTALETFTVPFSVSTIGDYVFEGCTSLSSFAVEEGSQHFLVDKGALYTKVGMFPGELVRFPAASSLTSYAMADGTSGIYKGAFSGASNLELITLSQAVESIKENTFNGCSNVQSLLLPRAVTSLDITAFTGMNSLSEISIAAGNPKYSTYQGVVFEISGNNNVSKVIFNPIMNKGIYDARNNVIALPFGCTQIADGAFKDSIMTQVFIPEGVTKIGAHAFEGCSALRDVYIPKTVTSIGAYAFADCTELLTVYAPLINYTAGNEFLGCTKLVLFYTQGTSGTASVTTTTLPTTKAGDKPCKLWDAWTYGATKWAHASEAGGQPVPVLDFTEDSTPDDPDDSTSTQAIGAGTMYYRPALDDDTTTYLWTESLMSNMHYQIGPLKESDRALPASKGVWLHRLYANNLILETYIEVLPETHLADWKSIKTKSGDGNEASYPVAVFSTNSQESIIGHQTMSWAASTVFTGRSAGATVVLFPEGFSRISQTWISSGVMMGTFHIPSTVTEASRNVSLINSDYQTVVNLPATVETFYIDPPRLQLLQMESSEKRWMEGSITYVDSDDHGLTAQTPQVISDYVILRKDTNYVAPGLSHSTYIAAPESHIETTASSHSNIDTYYHNVYFKTNSSSWYAVTPDRLIELGTESSMDADSFRKWNTSSTGYLKNGLHGFQFDFEVPSSWSTFDKSDGTQISALNIFGIGTFSGADEVTDPKYPITVDSNSKFYDMDDDPSTAGYLNEMGIFQGHLYLREGSVKQYGYIDNTSLMWVLTTDNTLIIHGLGEIPSFALGTAPWYNIISNGTVKQIHVCEGITAIGDGAFKTDNTKAAVKGIMLPHGLKTIGAQAFSGLKIVGQYIPDAVESLAKDAFRGCTLLEYIQMNGNEEYYTLDGAIYTKEKKLFFVPEAKDTLKIDSDCAEILDYAAYGGSLADIDLTKVNKIGNYAFYNTNLKVINIDHTIILGEYAFAKTENMEMITIGAAVDFPKGVLQNSTVKVLSFGNFTFSKFGTDSMPTGTWYDQGYDPREVNSVNAGEVFEGGHTYTRTAYALSVCSTGDESLKYYISFDSDGNPSLTIVFTTGNGIMASYPKDGAPWTPIVASMKAVTLPEGMKSIGDYAFSGLDFVGSNKVIKIPTTVRTIGNGSFEDAKITDLDLSSITAIGVDAFKGCTGLTAIETSDYIRTIPSGAFSGCTSLEQLTLGKNLTTVETGALTGSTSLTTLLLLGSATETVTFKTDSVSAENATWYRNAKASEAVTIATSSTVATGDFTKSAVYTKEYGTTTGVDISKVTGSGDVIATMVGDVLLITGKNALASQNLMRDFGTADATRAEWSDVVSIMIVNVGNIGSKAFMGLTDVASIALDGTIDIGDDAFNGCSTLTTVSLPETTTTIGAQAFKGCASLSRVDIDNEIQKIGSNALNETTTAISYSGNDLGTMSDYTATPIVNESVLKNYLLDRSAGYAVKAQMVRNLFDVTPGMLVVDTSKQLDLNGFIIQSKGYVFDVSGSPVVTDSNQRYSTYVFDKNGSYIISDYTEYTFKFKGGAIISGTHVMGVETVDDEAVYGDKALDYYMPRADVKLSGYEFDYTGSAIEPSIITVWVDGSVLRPSDYIVTYENNVNIGTGNVVLTAKLDSELTCQIPFVINGGIATSTVTKLDGITADISDYATYTVPATIGSDSYGFVTVSPEAGYTATVSATNAYVETFGTGVYRLVPTLESGTSGLPEMIVVTISVTTVNEGIGTFNAMMLTDSNNGALFELTAAEGSGGLMAGTITLYGVKYRTLDDGIIGYSAISIAETKTVTEGAAKVTWNPTLGNVGTTDQKYSIYYVYAVYEYTVGDDTNKVVCQGLYGSNPTLNDV